MGLALDQSHVANPRTGLAQLHSELVGPSYLAESDFIRMNQGDVPKTRAATTNGNGQLLQETRIPRHS
jgi:hypothetical protein